MNISNRRRIWLYAIYGVGALAFGLAIAILVALLVTWAAGMVTFMLDLVISALHGQGNWIPYTGNIFLSDYYWYVLLALAASSGLSHAVYQFQLSKEFHIDRALRKG